MGKRGELWFVIQFILFCAMILAPFIQHSDWPLLVRALGVVTLACGAIIGVLGYRTLAGSHSPWATPGEAAHLVTTGIYRVIRHPIYAGWILGALGLEVAAASLLGVGVAAAVFVFYDLRSRYEERRLVETHPDYAAYQRSVKRFIPRIY